MPPSPSVPDFKLMSAPSAAISRYLGEQAELSVTNDRARLHFANSGKTVELPLDFNTILSNPPEMLAYDIALFVRNTPPNEAQETVPITSLELCEWAALNPELLADYELIQKDISECLPLTLPRNSYCQLSLMNLMRMYLCEEWGVGGYFQWAKENDHHVVCFFDPLRREMGERIQSPLHSHILDIIKDDGADRFDLYKDVPNGLLCIQTKWVISTAVIGEILPFLSMLTYKGITGLAAQLFNLHRSSRSFGSPHMWSKAVDGIELTFRNQAVEAECKSCILSMSEEWKYIDIDGELTWDDLAAEQQRLYIEQAERALWISSMLMVKQHFFPYSEKS